MTDRTPQLLRLLSREPRTHDDLADRTAAPEDELTQLLTELTHRGWIEAQGEYYALTAAGAAQARWNTQLLMGGPIDPASHLHAVAHPPSPPVVSPKDPWWALREAQRRRSVKPRSSQLQPLRVAPVTAGTVLWWFRVVVVGILATGALVVAVVALLQGNYRFAFIPGLFGVILASKAVDAHRGKP